MSAPKPKLIKGIAPSGFAVTANLLLSGDVVYLGKAGQWIGDITHAVFFDQELKAQEIAQELGATAAHKIVGVYLIALDKKGLPLSTKEQLRAAGPSNYFHGKQQDMQTKRGRDVSLSEF